MKEYGDIEAMRSLLFFGLVMPTNPYSNECGDIEALPIFRKYVIDKGVSVFERVRWH